MESKADLP